MPVYAVPTAPGCCRILFSMLMPASGVPALFAALKALPPRWWDHVTDTSRVLAGDSALLHAHARSCWLPLYCSPSIHSWPQDPDAFIAAAMTRLSAGP